MQWKLKLEKTLFERYQNKRGGLPHLRKQKNLIQFFISKVHASFHKKIILKNYTSLRKFGITVWFSVKNLHL